MTLGLVALAPLGPAYAAIGVSGALVASVVGNLVAAALPAARCQIMGPRASATVVFAGLLAALVAQPAPAGEAPHLLTIAFATLMLSGIFLVLFALAGLGRAIKFVPYPVVAGFMNGIALTIVLSQLGPALGLEVGRPLAAVLEDPGAVKPAAVLVTLAVLAAIVLAPRLTSRVPPLLAGLLAGVALHHLLDALAPGAVGPVVGSLPAVTLVPAELGPILAFAASGEAGAWLGIVLSSALLLATVMALDGLLASVAADTVTRGHHDSRRVLLGQGLANVLGAAFGAVPAVANAHTRIGNYHAGGRTRLSTLFHALFMLAALLGLAPLLAELPVAALAGLVLYVAFTLLDKWTRDLARRLRARGGHRADIAVNLAIVAAVALTLVLVNMMAAFALGVAAAVTLLLVRLSGSPVRRVLDGTVRRSLKVRTAEARMLLEPLARQIRILELEGEIFFGTAEHLKSAVEKLPATTRYAILDFRRVHEIDASGARMIDLIAELAAQRGLVLLLSHIRTDEPRGEYLRALGSPALADRSHWFPDLDRALEWAEDRLLERSRFEDAPELDPGEMSLLQGLDDAERRLVLAALERHELAHGDPVFLENDPGDRLYLIARGAVSIKVQLDEQTRARRLATFSAGVFFGEMAIVEGTVRSADAFAKGEHVVLYSLHADRFAELTERHPALALKIYRNLSRELASRLRSTSAALRALE